MKTHFSLLLSLFLSSITLSQNLEDTFNFGKEQFNLGNNNSASLAFERVLFFSKDSFQIESLEYLGLIEEKNSEPLKAATYFNRAFSLSNNRNEQIHFILKKCENLLSAGEVQFALIDLYSIEDSIPDSLFHVKYLMQGIAQFSINSFEESRNSFKQSLSNYDLKGRMKVDSLFDVLVKIKTPNPRTAKILSMCLPGLGQFYAGDIKNGINSFLLTGGLFVLGMNIAQSLTFFDALLAVAPWFQRYYMGGYGRAEKIAEERLREKQNKIYLALINL